jgi:hypothetical protein
LALTPAFFRLEKHLSSQGVVLALEWQRGRGSQTFTLWHGVGDIAAGQVTVLASGLASSISAGLLMLLALLLAYATMLYEPRCCGCGRILNTWWAWSVCVSHASHFSCWVWRQVCGGAGSLWRDAGCVTEPAQSPRSEVWPGQA